MKSVLALVLSGLALVLPSSSELVHQWDVLEVAGRQHVWTATSFAVTKDQIYLSLIDDSLASGIVARFNTGSQKTPVLEQVNQKLFLVNSPQGIISRAVAVRADDCGQLWVLGSTSSTGSATASQPALFVLSRSSKEQLVHGTVLSKPSSDAFLVTFALGGDCAHPVAYIADFVTPRLVVYDFATNTSFVKKHHFFNPDPTIYVKRDLLFNRDTVNGIYGVAVADDTLYFHPLASLLEFSLPTKGLATAENILHPAVSVAAHRGSEATISVYDKESRVMFYAAVNGTEVGCWNLDFARQGKEATGVYNKLRAGVTQGQVQDLAVLDGKLWLLVRAGSGLEVHRQAVAELVKGTSCEAKPAIGTRFDVKPKGSGATATAAATLWLGLISVLLTCGASRL